MNVPFFWDGTFYSEIASKFYDGVYNPFDCPANRDNTTFPFFSTYLFLGWEIFGKTIWVSHLLLFPFVFGSCYQFYKLCKFYLTDRFIFIAFCLLLLQPTFVTQSIIMSYDIVLIFLFLFLINKLLNDEKNWYALVLPILALYSVRGFVLFFALMTIQFILLKIKNKNNAFITTLKYHLSGIIFIITWFTYHKLKTGWVIFSPFHENTDEHVHSISMMVRQTLFIIWKLIDLGQITGWMILLVGLIILKKRKKITTDLKIILTLLFVPLITTSIFMIPFSNPIGQKYFMFVFILLIVAICYVLQEIGNKKYQLLFSVLFGISLFGGNFLIYPEKYGNAWDASLKALPYFELKNKMDAYIVENKIPASEVGTQFPLIADKRYTHLADSSFCYNNVWRGPIDQYNYFLYTNVINTDIPDQIAKIKKEWILVQRFQSEEVYIELYTKKGLLFFQF